MTILDTINSPQDLKALSADKLEELAAEIRPVSYTHLTLPTIYSV